MVWMRSVPTQRALSAVTVLKAISIRTLSVWRSWILVGLIVSTIMWTHQTSAQPLKCVSCAGVQEKGLFEDIQDDEVEVLQQMLFGVVLCALATLAAKGDLVYTSVFMGALAAMAGYWLSDRGDRLLGSILKGRWSFKVLLKDFHEQDRNNQHSDKADESCAFTCIIDSISYWYEVSFGI